MRIFCALTLLCSLPLLLAAADLEHIALSQSQQKFAETLAAKSQALERKNTGAMAGTDGWLFLAAELRFLSVGPFWGRDAAKVSRSPKPELADPIPAIVDFHRQLTARGIELLLVPVPPKAAIHPEKIAPETSIHGEPAAPSLDRFYEALRAEGVSVLDLAPLFLENRDHARGPAFCKTDTHWSGLGCVLAAQALAESVRPKLTAPPAPKLYASEWKNTVITGDLTGLLPSTPPPPETVCIRSISEKGTGASVAPDRTSPLLLLGDSHTLVFHDFLTERAGLIDQLAFELGFPPDLIGTRGSGATPVRISLYRQSSKDPDYLAKKKVVIWCFTAREFTEAAQGWPKLPIAK